MYDISLTRSRQIIYGFFSILTTKFQYIMHILILYHQNKLFNVLFYLNIRFVLFYYINIFVLVLHTSASLALNESWDPDVRDDMEMMLNKIVPEGLAYRHSCEGPDDMVSCN